LPVYGSSSRFINEQTSIFSKLNSGNIQSVISNEYQKDYLIEMKMKDELNLFLKEKIAKNSFRKTTNA